MNKKRFHILILAVIILGLFIGWSGADADAKILRQESGTQLEDASIFPVAIGQIGGYTNAVAWQANNAYVGIGPRLYILDASDPTLPVLVGRSDVLPDIVNDVFIQGNYAYLADASGGFRILDISSPSRPVNISFINISAYYLSVAGNYAYFTCGNTLFIIDINDPDVPTVIGMFKIDVYEFISIAISGNYAYVGYRFYDGTDDGMLVIDISNPAVPVEKARINFYHSAINIFIAGNYAYVADGGLRIFDISNPVQPVEVSWFETPDSANDVYVVGKYAYIAEYMDGLCIVDIGHPSLPIMLGSVDTPGVALNLTIAGNFAYIADFDQGMRIIDISQETNPQETGYYKNNTLQSARALAVRGNYAYVGDQGGPHLGESPKYGLRIFDVSIITNPVEIGSLNTEYSVNDIALEGKYAYLAGGDTGLVIVDISDPTMPQVVGEFECSDRCPPDWAIAVKLSGNFAYIATGSDGVLVILDITNPTEPQLVGFFDTPGAGQNLSIQGNFVYFTDSYYGLHIIDITDPVWPVEISLVNTGGSSWGITLSGNYAYVADRASGLRIIDISDPHHPVTVGFDTGNQSCLDVSVLGNYAYLNCSPYFRIVDVSDPASPIEVGSYQHQGYSYGSVVRGNETLVAYSEMGLMSFQLFTDYEAASIPVGGGSLTSRDANTTVIFPSGAFTQTVSLMYWQMFTDEHVGYWAGIDHTFDLSAVYSDTGETANLVSGQAYTITINYTDDQVSPVFEDDIGLYSWNGTTWVSEPTRELDPISNIITATPDHLSLWAVLYEPYHVFMPLFNK